MVEFLTERVVDVMGFSSVGEPEVYFEINQ